MKERLSERLSKGIFPLKKAQPKYKMQDPVTPKSFHSSFYSESSAELEQVIDCESPANLKTETSVRVSFG